MSDQKDGSGAPENIEVIRDLLRKLEEVAEKGGERPVDEVAKPVASHLDLSTLRRGGTSSRPPAPELPEFPLAELPQSGSLQLGQNGRATSGALTTNALTVGHSTGGQIVVAEPASGSRGVVIAGLAFALGIATAIGVIFVFDPLKRMVSSSNQASRPLPTVVAAPTPTEKPIAQPSDRAPVAAAMPAEQPTAELASPVAREAPAPAALPAALADPSASVVVPPAPAIVLPGSPPSIDTPTGARSATIAPAEISPPPPSPATRLVSVIVPPRVSARAGSRHPLGLRLEPAPDESTAMLVVIRNVPEWITLSKGSTLGNEIWVLPAHVADGLELELADGADGSAAMKVQLATRDGRILAERDIAVETRRPTTPSSAPMRAGDPPQGELAVARLLARGELLIDTGEVEAARTLLRSAAEAGSVQAALKLAETYDPAQVHRLGMAVASADPAQAVRWYERAEALGSREATARLAALGKR